MSDKVIPTEIHNENGDFVRIEFHNTNGDHVIDAIWDERDEQTQENRIEFRKWAYKMLRDKEYEVD